VATNPVVPSPRVVAVDAVAREMARNGGDLPKAALTVAKTYLPTSSVPPKLRGLSDLWTDAGYMLLSYLYRLEQANRREAAVHSALSAPAPNPGAYAAHTSQAGAAGTAGTTGTAAQPPQQAPVGGPLMNMAFGLPDGRWIVIGDATRPDLRRLVDKFRSDARTIYANYIWIDNLIAHLPDDTTTVRQALTPDQVQAIYRTARGKAATLIP
jgi:hypothetical protein